MPKEEGSEPQRVYAENVHKVVGGNVGIGGEGPGDAGVGEEDVEAGVAAQGVVDDGGHVGLVGGVEAARVDGDGGQGSRNLGGVGVEALGVEVAQVDGAGAALGEAQRGGAADAEGRAGAWGRGEREREKGCQRRAGRAGRAGRVSPVTTTTLPWARGALGLAATLCTGGTAVGACGGWS